MAAVKDAVKSTIRTRLLNGTDPMTGKPQYVYRSFNNLKPSADPTAVFDTIEQLMSLQKLDAFNYEQIDYSELRHA